MIIVTGCPRSGTSIMMRSLYDAIGAEHFIASQWPEKIKRGKKQADRIRDMNPDGFFECRYTVKGAQWHADIEDTRDKFCKIISKGVAKSNPIYIQKMIVMARNPRAVAKSQERLIRDMIPPDNPDGYVVHSPDIFIRDTIQLAKWMLINETPHIVVNYDNLVSDPDTTFGKVADFLDMPQDAFANHTVRESLRRSEPQPIEHHLWEVADAIFDALKRSDWTEIANIASDNWRSIDRDRRMTPCARLGGERMTYAECINCLHKQDTRVVFKNKAERRGIDWKSSPCNYLSMNNAEGDLVDAQETIASNHWSDTAPPPPPPRSKVALAALATSARVVGHAAKSGRVRVRKDVLAQRLASCRSCTAFIPDEKRCGACGCNIFRAAKFIAKECPKERWKE